MGWLFPSVVESVEEAVLNSLFRAKTVVGRDGHVRHAVPVEKVVALVSGGYNSFSLPSSSNPAETHAC